MNNQTTIHCHHCGKTIPQSQIKQLKHKCPQCGHVIDSVAYPLKAGRMSQRQLILMMVLLPLLVVAMTVGSWYLIKAYRLPSAGIDENPAVTHAEFMHNERVSLPQDIQYSHQFS